MIPKPNMEYMWYMKLICACVWSVEDSLLSFDTFF